MELKCLSRTSLQRVGAEGLLVVLSSVPFMLAAMIGDTATPPLWRMAAAGVASFSCLAAAFLLLRRPQLGRIFGGLALAGSTIVIVPFFESNPITVLLGAVMIIGAGYALTEFRPCRDGLQRSSPVDRCLQRARWGAMTMSGLVLAVVIVDRGSHALVNTALIVSVGVTIILVMHWIWRQFAPVPAIALIMVSLVAICAVIFSFMNGYFRLTAFIVGILAILVLPDSTQAQEWEDHWWKVLLSHPARVLLTTFLALCSLGTFLLLLPGAATHVQGIAFVDAAFTSVSAVCVTGLTVLDTPHDFTLFGQGLILLLIQLGGLGIMSIATVGMHALGRRMSLHHERLLTSMTDTDHQDLVVSLVTILRFTLIAEAMGTLTLTGLFHISGDNWGQAVWRGLFTAISAFCNAGFALQSDNLIPYQGNPFVLHVVALLIIFGGLAPATSLLVPRWLAGRPVAVGVRLVLMTTTVLLISGALFFLAFEWHGALSGMTVGDKIHNAWFQSVTLRTAGFNSVDLAGVMNPSCLIMICLMFIGGSPGGTAGGVKTTTIALLVLTFWASVTGRSEVIVQNRRIPPGTINRAITIVTSGALVWIVMVLMLEMTQQIPARELLFEVTSALGTVGLSLGATNHLDGIGKIIVMLAMFAGRIGPMTLFMLLSEERSVSVTRCLDAKISLT